MDREKLLDIARQMGGTEVKKRDVGTRQATKKTARTNFTTLAQYQEIALQRKVGELLELDSPFFNLIEGAGGAVAMLNGKEVINYASYDYLGLNTDARIAQAAVEMLEYCGMSASGSRPTSGNRAIHIALEEKFSKLYETEAALVFVSGHGTNVSTIGELLGANDLILFDALSHNSITVGARLSPATRRRFAHNDVEELEEVLRQNRNKHERVLIVVEGLYSMDGDMPKLAELVRIKNKYDAWLMVDEAHSLGVLGKTGKGVFEQLDIDPREIDIWMGTTSKTLSGCGGYIAGKAELIELLRYKASGFMYSVGMPPPVAAANLRALELMEEEPERVARLQENGKYFMESAQAAGLDTGLSEGFAVVPIIVGESLRAVKLGNLLIEKGIFAFPVTFPAVPERSARLRFFVTSEHNKSLIDKTIETVKETLEEVKKMQIDVSSIMKEITTT